MPRAMVNDENLESLGSFGVLRLLAPVIGMGILAVSIIVGYEELLERKRLHIELFRVDKEVGNDKINHGK